MAVRPLSIRETKFTLQNMGLGKAGLSGTRSGLYDKNSSHAKTVRLPNFQSRAVQPQSNNIKKQFHHAAIQRQSHLGQEAI